VSVFAVTYAEDAAPTAEKVAEVPVGDEPWQVTMLPDGDSALVVCRKGQTLAKVTGLRGVPAKAGEVALHAEPTGVAVTPTGAEAWAANWVEGTVQVIDTTTMAVKRTIDLNATLAASGLLGAGVRARPALAHPRSVAISNNGDDDETNEVVYVTEYFAQAKAPLAPDGSNADVHKVGVVYRIPLATGEPSIVELPPMADMGFADHEGGKAGCFPNQLQGITVQGSYGYVVSVCASPKGPADVYAGPAAAACDGDAACPGRAAGSCAGEPGRATCQTNCERDADCGANGGACAGFVCEPNVANVKTLAASVVSVIDLLTLQAVATVSLHREFDRLYDQLGLPDTAARRYPALANDIAFVPGTVQAYVTAGGADALYRVDFDPNYVAASITSVGDPRRPLIPTAPAGVDASRTGRLPTGVIEAAT
jgi:DNA-binding beta-propeller fold protein YncE